MRSYITWIFTLSLFVFTSNSCSEKDETEVNTIQKHSLIGNWSRIGFDNNHTILIKTKTLTTDGYGISIQENGKFVERKNAGWCGTPPITYDNYNGTWKAKNDSTLTINVAYWGGQTTYDLKVMKVKADTLTVEFIYPQNGK